MKFFVCVLCALVSRSAALVHGIDASCHAQAHTDYDGPSLTWGLDYKLPTAQACCNACKQRRAEGCNSWIWCPEPLCWSPDVWNHTQFECWLKVQKNPLSPAVNFRGSYPREFRREHKTAPEKVQWMAGVLI